MTQPDTSDLCFGLRQRAAALGTLYQADIDFYRACATRLEELEYDQAELADGHLALDRLGAAREQHGCDVAICERVNEVAERLRAALAVSSQNGNTP